MAVLPTNPNQQINPNDPNQPNQRQLAGKKQQGTGFTNLQRVLGANQRTNLGGTFGNRLGQNVAQQQQKFGQAQQQFGQQAEQQRLDSSQNQQLRQQQIGALAAPGTISTAENTQQYNVSPEIAQSFQKMRSGSYVGPTGLENESQLQGQGQQLAGLGQQFGSQGGRFNLLRQTVARGPYMQGQQRLDEAILSSQRQQAKPAIQQGMQAGQQIQQGINAAQQYGQELTGKAAQFGEETKQQIQEAANKNLDYLQNVAKQAETEKQARLKSIQDQMAAGTGDIELDAKLAKELGIQGGEDAWDTGQTLKANEMKANIENVASASDYARMKALQDIGGAETQGYLGQKGFNTAATDQARKFYENQLTYDKGMADALRQNRIQSFQNAQTGNIQGLVDTIRDLQFAKARGDGGPIWMRTGPSADYLEKVANDRIGQIQNEAAQQGLKWNGQNVLNSLRGMNLMDTDFYRGVRQNVLNDIGRATAARTFKIKPEEPSSTS